MIKKITKHEYLDIWEKILEDHMKKQTALTEKEMNDLHALCLKFINDQKIDCAETIHQTDWVIENAYEFIEDICEIVGYAENE